MDGRIFFAMSCGRFVDLDVRYVCIRDWKDGRGALGGKEVASVWWICARDVWSAAGVAVGFVSRFRFLDDLLDKLAVAAEADATSSVVGESSGASTAALLLSMVGCCTVVLIWYVCVGFVRGLQSIDTGVQRQDFIVGEGFMITVSKLFCAVYYSRVY